MTFQPGANLYTQGFGSRAENVEVPHLDLRDPSSTDINYPIGKTWMNTSLGTMFFLPSFTSLGGVLAANWTKLEDVNGALNTLSNGTTKVQPDASGNISLTGTNGEIIATSNPGSNNIEFSFPNIMFTPGSLEVSGDFVCDSGAHIEGGIVNINHGSPFATLIGYDMGGGVTIDSNPSNPISIGPSGATLNLGQGGGTVNINTTGSGTTSIGNASGGAVVIDSGSDIVIGDINASGSTVIDSGSGGVLILNDSGNNHDVIMGPTLPNATSGNIILNSGDFSGTIQFNGGQTVIIHPVVTEDTTVTVSHYFIPCDTTSAILTVFLPGSPRTGQHMVVSDIAGNASSNAITVSGNGQTINGMASQDITVSYGRFDLYYTGTMWSLGR